MFFFYFINFCNNNSKLEPHVGRQLWSFLIISNNICQNQKPTRFILENRNFVLFCLKLNYLQFENVENEKIAFKKADLFVLHLSRNETSA